MSPTTKGVSSLHRCRPLSYKSFGYTGDATIQSLLRCLPELEVLKLTDSTSKYITKEAFRGGHHSLRLIVTMESRLDNLGEYREKFPPNLVIRSTIETIDKILEETINNSFFCW